MIPRLISFLGILPCVLGTSSSAFCGEGGGHLGVLLGDVPEVLASHLGLKGGALVVKVVPDTAAAKAGLKAHDVIVSIGDESVNSPREDVVKQVRQHKPGDKLQLKVKRGEKSVQLEATLGSRGVESSEPAEEEAPKPQEPGFLGVGSGEVPPVLAVHLELKKGVGVIVEDVWKGSAAEKAGIVRNDLLVAVDGYEVKGPAGLAKQLEDKKAGQELSLELFHKGARKTVKVVLAPRPKQMFQPFPFGNSKTFRGPGGWHEFHQPLDPNHWKVQPGWRGPWGPRTFYRGKMIFLGPDGKEQEFQFPEHFWSGGDMESLQKELEKHKAGDAFKGRLKDMLKEFDVEVGIDGSEEVEWSSVSKSQFVVRHVDGGYDITVSGTDGLRKVTVKKDGKTLAEDLPYKKLDTLPKPVQERVEKILQDHKPEISGSKVKVKVRVQGKDKEQDKDEGKQPRPIDPDPEGGIKT